MHRSASNCFTLTAAFLFAATGGCGDTAKTSKTPSRNRRTHQPNSERGEHAVQEAA